MTDPRRGRKDTEAVTTSILSGRLRADEDASPGWEFSPSFDIDQEFRLSHRFDFFSISQARAQIKEFVRVDGAYKRKGVKIRQVERCVSDGSSPGGNPDWRKKALAREAAMPKPFFEKYPGWLIPKFSSIARGARMTPERLQKINVGECLTVEERDHLTELLYNREAALAWDFSEMGMVLP